MPLTGSNFRRKLRRFECETNVWNMVRNGRCKYSSGHAISRESMLVARDPTQPRNDTQASADLKINVVLLKKRGRVSA